jgi:hypothetical protein
MRNAVIRKKRLKAERIVDDLIRMPQRLIVTGDPAICSTENWSSYNNRLWAI